MSETPDTPFQAIAIDGSIVAPTDSGKGGPIDNGTMLLAYLSFMGDVEKTAAALHCAPEYVQHQAEEHKWDVQIERLKQLKQQQGTDALAIELNRTVNFVQAVRMRNLFDRLVRDMTDDDKVFEEFTTIRGHAGTEKMPAKPDQATCKPLLELAKAISEIHRMTYQALGDTQGERTDKDEGASNVSLSVLRALSASAGAALPK